MIPVNMRHQHKDIHASPLGDQMITQWPDSCPGVDNNHPARIERDLKTAGIAAIYDGIFSRGCNRPPCPPKFYFHLCILACLQGLCQRRLIAEHRMGAFWCGVAGYVISSGVSIQKAMELKQMAGPAHIGSLTYSSW